MKILFRTFQNFVTNFFFKNPGAFSTSLLTIQQYTIKRVFYPDVIWIISSCKHLQKPKQSCLKNLYFITAASMKCSVAAINRLLVLCHIIVIIKKKHQNYRKLWWSSGQHIGLVNQRPGFDSRLCWTNFLCLIIINLLYFQTKYSFTQKIKDSETW